MVEIRVNRRPIEGFWKPAVVTIVLLTRRLHIIGLALRHRHRRDRQHTHRLCRSNRGNRSSNNDNGAAGKEEEKTNEQTPVRLQPTPTILPPLNGVPPPRRTCCRGSGIPEHCTALCYLCFARSSGKGSAAIDVLAGRKVAATKDTCTEDCVDCTANKANRAHLKTNEHNHQK